MAEPIRAAWQNLKDNAKRRGKHFDISYEDFARFCVKTEYIAGKGRTKDSFTIDRIDQEKGYTIDNIQILTLSENTKKYLIYCWETKSATVVSREQEPEEVDNPF